MASDISVNQNDDELWRNAYDAGVAAISEGAPENAVDALQRAVALKPADPSTNFNLGVACLRTKRFEEACKAFEAFRSFEPDRSSWFRPRTRRPFGTLGRYLGV